MSTLIGNPLSVVNLGIDAFADPIAAAGVPVTRVQWSPPAGGDAQVVRALANLVGNPVVEDANRQAFAAYLDAEPVLEGIGIAREVIRGMGSRTLLHSGPPIGWDTMCGPMQGAVIGAAMLEGWARDAEEAREIAGRGEISFAPCHHHGAVGPMAGVISPSMPVWIVRNARHGNMTYSNLNEGLGKVLRYGANSPEVLDRLRWMASHLAPVVEAALHAIGPIELKPLMARALHMGDEMHNRNVAASGLLMKQLVLGALKAGISARDAADALEFVVGNDFFFLNVSMAACKNMLDAARGVPGSSMVTTMARNGVEFGIRVSGTGDTWFTAPAPMVEGLYFSGYTRADAARDIGDSAITETAGIGGFAMAAAPAIVQFVGGTPQLALANTMEMLHITLGQNAAFTIPQLEFAGTPAGIDVRKVVDTGILPAINTGIAHREPGVGQVGAGLTRAPAECFTHAVVALAGLVTGGAPR
ncbi:MAG: DUF1116 domain-containing protein [Betaproteobacteria bacterium]|jgi:hypothetical protein|nr:DUF1116 domain-containing protein [Betaproteobacteria bacterium]